MNLPTWYDAGTVSVATGSAIVTGFNNFWGDDAIMAGDLFCDPAQPLIPPQRVKSAKLGELELWTGWPGAALVQARYEVRYVGIIERSTAQTRRVLEQLGDVKAWYDIIVADDAARLALETPSKPLPANYRVIVKDTNFIWAKKSSLFGDWIGPVEFRGPSITLDVTQVYEVPYGTPPEVNMTPRAGGYDLAFDIPRGVNIEPGTTTTLAPDQPAAVTFVPVAGGYRLDIAIPRGPTGNIDGVTPFWVSRLGADADAAAARAGLGALSYVSQTLTLDQRGQGHQNLGTEYVLIGEQNVTNAADVRFLNLGAYSELKLVARASPHSVGAQMYFRTSPDNFATIRSGASDYNFRSWSGASTFSLSDTSTAALAPVSVANFQPSSSEWPQLQGLVMEISGFNKVSPKPYAVANHFTNIAGLQTHELVRGRCTFSEAQNALLFGAVGQPVSGNIKLYGRKG